MKIITSINEKGGVGKTTLAVTLACGLAAKGYSVLLMDTDEQGHTSVALGFKKEPGLFELLQRNGKWSDVLRTVPPERFMIPGNATMNAGRLVLLPSNTDTRALDMLLRPEAHLLRRRLEQVSNVFDYTIIDAGPASSLRHILIYTATDYVICPTKPEYLCFDGLVEALSHLETATDLRQAKGLPPVQIAGIVPTMYRKGTLEHEENLKELQKAYGDLVWPTVAHRTLWAEALAPASNYTPVYAYAPASAAAIEAKYMIDRIEGLTQGANHEQSA